MAGGLGRGGPAQPVATVDPARSVVVVVPYTRIQKRLVYPKRYPQKDKNEPMFMLEGPHGKAFLYSDRNFVQLYPLRPGFSLEATVRSKVRQWDRAKPAQPGYDLVVEALSYGMVDEAFKVAENTARVVAERKETPQESVSAFIRAYKEIQPALVDPAPDTGEAARWQSTLGASAVEVSNHYALVTWGDQSVSREGARRRLEALETNFRAFYLWHALSGVALPKLNQKLIVVLADKSTDLPRLREALDGQPIVSDAFYSPHHNLVVFSPERLDDAGRRFNKFAQDRYQVGWNRDELLKGIAPPLKTNETVADIAQVMTIALVDRLVEEESMIGMVTREGSRQLYAACGLLNQHVILPEWVENGAANLLHKPKGPVVLTEPGKGPVMTVGLTTGYGSPNFVLVRQFRDLTTRKDLNTKSEELLMNTLMDRYFDAVREEKDIDPPSSSDKDGVPLAGGAGGTLPGFGGPAGVGPGGAAGAGGGAGVPGPPSLPGVPGGPAGLNPGGPALGGAGGIGSADGGFAGGIGGFPAGAGQPDPNAERRMLKTKLELKSQVTSWALTFYLAKRKLPDLLKFYTDLNRMPRDMRLDRELVLHSFCRTFGLMETTNPNQIDKLAFKKFADEWVDFLRRYSTYGTDIPIQGGQGEFNPGGGAGAPGGPGPIGGPGGIGSPDGN
jgi:hypothetical protein